MAKTATGWRRREKKTF